MMDVPGCLLMLGDATCRWVRRGFKYFSVYDGMHAAVSIANLVLRNPRCGFLFCKGFVSDLQEF